MFSVAIIIVSLIAGYTLVAALTMFATFAIAKLSPTLAIKDHRLSNSYNLLQDLLWLIFSAAGGFVAVAVAGSTGASPLFTAAALAVILLVVIWSNHSEARQRGFIHMLITSTCIVAGIAGAYVLRMKQIQVS
jgi:hypothetical protein